MSIQINEKDWRPMSEPVELPALLQYNDGTCQIWWQKMGICPTTNVLRWQPFKQPELPKKDAFAEWFRAQNGRGYNQRELWNAATAHANKRFSDGVEKLAQNVDGPTPYYVRDFIGDLRALARGEESDK